jgi:hypothetical protein
MLKQLLLRKAAKNGTAPFLSTPNDCNKNGKPPSEDSALRRSDRNFSFADAEKLAQLLSEESRKTKSGFFRQRPRRTKMKRALSESGLQAGIEAPTSTPDPLFLSRVPSTSTTSISHSHGESGLKNSSLSLVETCSTTSETEIIISTAVSLSKNDTLGIKLETAAENPTTKVTADITSTSQPTESSSLGSNIKQAKRWSRTLINDCIAPIRRYQIRQGKQPFIETKTACPAAGSSLKTPEIKISKERLAEALSTPSSSQKFLGYNLEGGYGPPKPLSVKTLDKLDHFDGEIVRVTRELSRIKKEKEDFLNRIESEDYIDEEDVVHKSKKHKKKSGKKDKRSQKGMFNKGAKTEKKLPGVSFV